MSVRHQEVLPDPKRVIEGLRDTGYLFETAVADIIDNSIAAEATIVDIVAEMDFVGNIRISISDNGYGMNQDDLIDAMRYGSRERPNPASLGKFGLGLKTASTAFCRKLSVISRSSGSETPNRATWDLDHVVGLGKWDLLLSEPETVEQDHLETVADGRAGTVVVWDKIDRLLKAYSDPGGVHARKALDKHLSRLKDHVAMVYQRFLDPLDDRAENVKIIINGDEISAWDPFCTEESQKVAEKTISVELPDKSDAEFSVRAFVLPRKEEFSSTEKARAARISNHMQGIYIYRENRLIHGPDWLGMFRKEPHCTLGRVEFSFDHKLDQAFHIDIKKSQVILNEDLYNWMLNDFLPVPRRAATQVYRKGMVKKVSDDAKSGTHDSSNSGIRSKADDLRSSNINVIDRDKNDVELQNKHGKFRLKLKISEPTRPGELHVQPADSIDDGLLWEPIVIEGNEAVQINTSHPYYHKVYVPNKVSGVTIQGLDSLLWALCSSELGTISDTTKKHFEELRYEVSRKLRALVADLPEPEMDE